MKPRTTVVVLIAAAMVTATMIGGGGATVPTVDTAAGDATATTSEIQDDSTFGNVSGVNDNETFVMQVNVTPDDTVEMKVQVNGSDTVVHRNTSPENVSVAGGGNSGAHYNASFVGTDIDDMERTVDENVTVDVTFYDADNETDPGAAASTGNATTATIFLDFDDDRTVENLDDDDANDSADAVTTNDLTNEFLDSRISGIHALDFSTLDVDDRAINGETTEVVLVFSNDTVADDAANAVSSDAGDGDPLFGMPITVTGDETTRLVRVFNEEPPDSVDDDDDGDTYAVYHDGGIGGEDGIVVHLGGEFEDDDEVAVTGTLNAALVDRIRHRISTTDFPGLNALNDGSILSVGIGLESIGTGTMVLFLIGAPVARRKPVEASIEVDGPAGPAGSNADGERVAAEG